MRTILLNPGPVTLSARVRSAMLRDDLCHREPEFSELQHGIRGKLLDVYDLDPDEWGAVLLSGSGTAAVEAMLTSLVPGDGRVLVAENGIYGERIGQIAASHGIPFDRVTTSWGEAIDLSAVERALGSRVYTHFAVVHHETTTGRLNELACLAEMAAAYGVRLLVDGVSSFGAEAIDFSGWQFDACAATANKCLHGVPGIAFVIVRRTAIASPPSRTLYLNLASYLAQQDQRTTPFTQAVQTCYALDEALDEFFEAGSWRGRRALFRSRIGRVREVLVGHAVKPLLTVAECSCVLHSFKLPTGLSYDALHDDLKRSGFIVYPGQGGLAGEIFRISTMGDITENDLVRLLGALSRIFTPNRGA